MESRTFKDILTRQGVKAAIAWRESRVFQAEQAMPAQPPTGGRS
jgi:hypothetical protein